jgi:hypothetical protein
MISPELPTMTRTVVREITTIKKTIILQSNTECAKGLFPLYRQNIVCLGLLVDLHPKNLKVFGFPIF